MRFAKWSAAAAAFIVTASVNAAQAPQAPAVATSPQPAFQAPGLYSYSRHPMMIGTLIFVWATPDMTQGHALFAAVMTLYVLLAVRWEERDLERTHGDAYRAYRLRVRRF